MHDGEINTIYERLGARTEHAPEAVAIRAPGRSDLTYHGLLTQIDHVVRSLSVRGVRCSDRVAIVLPNGPEMAVAFLGVAAAAICAPLNPAYRRSEFEFYLADLNPKGLIVQAGMNSAAVAVAEERGIPIIELLAKPEAAAGIFTLRDNDQPLTSDCDFPHADDVALILHTSGTTSCPKIVPLTHANLLASASNIAALLRLSEADRCLNVMPSFHIHGLVGALLSSVMAGASVICTSGFDAEKFFSWIETLAPTWYTAVPTIHHAVLSHAQAAPELSRNHSLRFIRSSSSALPARITQGLEELFHVPVIEAYGMTEAAHQIASNPLPPGQRKVGSVGIAAGPEVSIMDEHGNRLSVGEVGEIVIHGANVTSGYLNTPASDNESLDCGWFRTDDQGYLDVDGYLFITGRLNEIINRGGEKIAPREVEDIILSHPAVAQAVAFAVPHPTLGEDVAAAIVFRPQSQASGSELRQFAATRLADFKVPHQLIFVDDIPKGASGKVQRNGLAVILAEQLKTKGSAAIDDLQQAVANIIGEVLGVEQVSAMDDFFALGGDSLRAFQVIGRIRARFDVNLSIATVFAKPTVTELADEIGRVLADREYRETVV